MHNQIIHIRRLIILHFFKTHLELLSEQQALKSKENGFQMPSLTTLTGNILCLTVMKVWKLWKHCGAQCKT